MPKVDFNPQQHGFHFVNYFTNVIQPLPGMTPITTRGRCGGMAFAALDHYFAGKPVPAYSSDDFPGTGVPSDGSPLADYIMKRQVDSLLSLSAVNVLTWSVAPDVSTFFIRGVSRRTKEVEFDRVRQSIDQGKPVPLVVIVARSLAELGSNHQVVAYGYDYEPDGARATVYLYDPNCPDQECVLSSDATRLGFDEASPSGLCNVAWRGFFVQDYAPQRPPADLTAVVRREAAAVPAAGVRALAPARSTPRRAKLTVKFEAVTFHHDDSAAAEPVALEFHVNDQAARWPRRGTRLAADGRRYVLDLSFDVAQAADDRLAVDVRPVGEELDALAKLGEVAGASAVYDKAGRWGRGRHAVRSAGAGGGFTVEYTIATKKAAR
jgi:hypothetical protein